MKDLASLLKALDPDADLAGRHVWLIKLFEWIRGDQTSVPAAVARVQAFMDAVERQPELRTVTFSASPAAIDSPSVVGVPRTHSSAASKGWQAGSGSGSTFT